MYKHFFYPRIICIIKYNIIYFFSIDNFHVKINRYQRRYIFFFFVVYYFGAVYLVPGSREY